MVAAVAAAGLACADEGEGTLAEAGRKVYMGNCIACHHPDPRVEGSMGPEIAGASLQLIEARVVRAEYPAGYTPKRDSKLMPAQPYLTEDVPALAAYLADLTPAPAGQ